MAAKQIEEIMSKQMICDLKRSSGVRFKRQTGKRQFSPFDVPSPSAEMEKTCKMENPESNCNHASPSKSITVIAPYMNYIQPALRWRHPRAAETRASITLWAPLGNPRIKSKYAENPIKVCSQREECAHEAHLRAA